MSGLRLDQASFSLTFILWVLVFAASAVAYAVTFLWGNVDQDHLEQIALVYAVAVWATYYGGLSLVLGTGVRAWLIGRFGEDAVRRGFCAVLGVVFMHQGLAQAAVMDTWAGTFTASPGWLMLAAAYGLVALGTVVKVWATYASSLDTYYYVDMLIGRSLYPNSEAVTSGPFRWFSNPMYGVGNLQAYGSALLAASWPGLVVAGAYHATLYGFYFLFERPFVQRTYGAAETG